MLLRSAVEDARDGYVRGVKYLGVRARQDVPPVLFSGRLGQRPRPGE